MTKKNDGAMAVVDAPPVHRTFANRFAIEVSELRGECLRILTEAARGLPIGDAGYEVFRRLGYFQRPGELDTAIVRMRSIMALRAIAPGPRALESAERQAREASDNAMAVHREIDPQIEKLQARLRRADDAVEATALTVAGMKDAKIQLRELTPQILPWIESQRRRALTARGQASEASRRLPEVKYRLEQIAGLLAYKADLAAEHRELLTSAANGLRLHFEALAAAGVAAPQCDSTGNLPDLSEWWEKLSSEREKLAPLAQKFEMEISQEREAVDAQVLDIFFTD